VGGFQLLVDAGDAAAVARLRRRKRRAGKPFALLVADSGWLAALVRLEPAEQAALADPAAPIVLLRRRRDAAAALPGVAPASPTLGVMLPASPLHLLLARAVGRPLVCTSGNRSGEPMCIDSQEAATRLAGIADALLVHDRPIQRLLEDSVLQVVEGRPLLLRRARGFAPEVVPLAPASPGREAGGGAQDPAAVLQQAATAEPPTAAAVIGLGSDLKSAPALAIGAQCWLAPHLGDLAEPRSLRRLEQGLWEWLRAQDRSANGPGSLGSAAVSLACDAHPGYFSHQLAASVAASCAAADDIIEAGRHPGPAAAPEPWRGLTPGQGRGVDRAEPAADGQQLPGQGAATGPARPPQPASPSRCTDPAAASARARAPAAGSEPQRAESIALPLGQGRLPLWAVPHHLAHGLAVVAEHGLRPPLLLVAFDGLGYGLPSAPAPDPRPPLRGGELLWLHAHPDGSWRVEAAASLRPFALPGGERALLEPRRSALGLLDRAAAHDHPGAWRLRRAFAAADRRLLLKLLAAGCQSPQCSSVGRLFDAVASLLGLVQVLAFEGQGGLRLQAAAERGLARAGVVGDAGLPLQPAAAGQLWLDWGPLLAEVLAGAVAGADRRRTAARFHLCLAEGLAAALTQLVRRRDLSPSLVPVALAGGCFQNRLLLELAAAALRRRGFGVHWSEAVPTNDGGLALGQIQAVRQALRQPG
jgi:hydrogenase maturation factor HypF (carbamoyltransferase family)